MLLVKITRKRQVSSCAYVVEVVGCATSSGKDISKQRIAG